MMELFTLGASTTATVLEDDVREQARALTGWTSRLGRRRRLWSTSTSTPSATTTAGSDLRQDRRLRLARLVPALRRPPRAPGLLRRASCGATSSRCRRPQRTRKALEQLYVKRDHAIRPVVEAILMHPSLLPRARAMVKPPIVYIAGHAARAAARGDDRRLDLDLRRSPASALFQPPNVAGWDEHALARHLARSAGAGSPPTRSTG